MKSYKTFANGKELNQATLHYQNPTWLTKPTLRWEPWRTRNTDSKIENRCCQIHGLVRTKHLRRREAWLQEFNTICAAVADEPETNLIWYREAHAAFVAGCAGYSKTSRRTKFMQKNYSNFDRLHNSISRKDPNPDIVFVRPTACVSRKWVGCGECSKTEFCWGAENCLKTRRLPLVGCTLC